MGPMTGTMNVKVAKALVRAVRFRDFTHWRLASPCGPEFVMDLGYGYTVIARPDPDPVARRTVFGLVWQGNGLELRLRTDRADLTAASLELSGPDCRVRLSFPEKFDADEYVRRRSEKTDGSVGPREIGGIQQVTDIVYDGSRSEWSGTGDADGRGIDERLIDALLWATCNQEFGFLEDLENEARWMDPVSLRFTDLELADYCAEISATVDGAVEGVLGYRMRGALTSGREGILVRGRGATFTITADDSDHMKGTECDYLAEHKAPVWSAKHWKMEPAPRSGPAI